MTPSTAAAGGSMAEINVVPYIDVMLVLLIIFMVTAPLLTQGIKVDLPKAGAEPLPQDMMRDHQPLILSVDASGGYYLNIGEDEDSPIDEDAVRPARLGGAAPGTEDARAGQGRSRACRTAAS